MTNDILHEKQFDNGLELIFIDLTNRYYGDFYQVKIDVINRIQLTDTFLSRSGLTEREQAQARNRFGAVLESHKELKRMGVAGPDVKDVTSRMIQQFLDSSLPYLTDAKFPSQLLKKQLSDRPNLRPMNG